MYVIGAAPPCPLPCRACLLLTHAMLAPAMGGLSCQLIQALLREVRTYAHTWLK